ncbi:DNA-directed RNA polymerase subunit beta [Solibacillus sp. FSL W8-0372]|uniref:DNA-directed RNA polymerase subunit beta n=1 Tax=Solibacillus sp. FSL W8-0372 TaxID=2921713 RepID=UPI0030D58AED
MTKELDRRVVEQASPAKKTRRSLKEASEPNTDQPTRWVRLRLIPIWLRIIVVILVFGIATIAGLIVGYSIIGDGATSDVLKGDTWQHLLNIINGKE